MLDNPRKALIIGASVILVILIIFTLILSNLTKSRVSEESISPTPVSADTLPNTGNRINVPQRIVPTLTEDESRRLDEVDVRKAKIQELSDKLAPLHDILPYSTNDFAIAYSTDLGEFFVQRKTSSADDKFQQFLKDNDLLDLYLNNPDLFVFTNQPIEQVSQTNISQQQSQRNESMLRSFTDFAGTLFSFDTKSPASVKEVINSILTPTPEEGSLEESQLGTNGSNSGRLQDVVYWAQQINQRIQYCSIKRNYSTMAKPLSSGGYIGHSGTCNYACTYNVIDSYRLAGIKGLTDAQSFVYEMRKFWQTAGPPYKYLPYSQTSNKLNSLRQLKPGCALMQGRAYGAEHVEVIYNVKWQNNVDGYIEVYSTNSRVNQRKYTIAGGLLFGTWDSPVDFGCLR